MIQRRPAWSLHKYEFTKNSYNSQNTPLKTKEGKLMTF